MSRFFAGGSSDSDTSSSDEELYSDSEEEQSEQELSSSGEEDSEMDSGSDSGSDDDSSDEDGPGGFLKAGAKAGASRFLRGEESEDSDEEDTKRVVKSAKDKRLEEIETTIKTIDNAKKINDWVHISTEFDKLNKLVSKAGSTDTPKSYVVAISDLEDFMNEAIKGEKEAKKKMNATNARALNSIKQRIRKNNRQYEDQIARYKADPEAFAADEPVAPVVTPAKKAPAPAALLAGEAPVDGDGFSTVGKGGKTVQVSADSIFKQLRTILESRGRKNTDRGEQIRTLEALYDIAQTTYQRLRILTLMVSTRFDLATSALSYMPVEQWKVAVGNVETLLKQLEDHPLYTVRENAEEYDDEEAEPVATEEKPVSVFGSVISYVEKLDDEFTRSLQNIDPHTPEYIERLSEESSLYNLMVRAQSYFERVSLDTSVNRVLIRRLEHLYYKPAQLVDVLEKAAGAYLPEVLAPRVVPVGLEASALIVALCVVLYKQEDRHLRTRALLCHVYHHALHNQYYMARDLMLMSHLQASIHSADIFTQILYNRTLVQIGLCAFRVGMIAESQQALQEICGTGRTKELLAQGIQMQRYSQVTPEQERLEKQRQIPFHMHINLELLECVYLTCSMLLEIPVMAQLGTAPDAKKKAISKPFRRMFDYHERQVFTGPPENTREYVMQASKALAVGEWARARDLIQSIKIWDLVPETDKIKAMLGHKIQEEGLRTYLFTNAPFYESLSITSLADMFDLPAGKAGALVSKMISNNEIAAALDQRTGTIAFIAGVELSRLQNLALALSDKAVQLSESQKFKV
ncbi:eukaryotic translation initiation factor 3 subunit 8 N-terminus-domain-containing protein [Dipodascopsis tothii]|uniref:eukaryotic translation initiation factor 3 subunit 8 N-terminus-domain-containing protein n=1 Tax=Dipodascopsis tothii TaxID=44089 RepID=UPI0034CFC30C